VSVDGIKTATVSSDILEKGWNMGLLEKGPVADQCRQIQTLVATKEQIVAQWRGESRRVYTAKATGQPDLSVLEGISKQLLDADKNIRDAAQPKTHHFTIAAAHSGK